MTKRALKYGPQAQLLWKHAGKPATQAAQTVVAAAGARRTALKHAETLTAGAVLKTFDAGRVHWVVFSAATPVASYPPVEDLTALVRNADLTRKMTPSQMRARRAAQSRRRKAVEGARSLGEQVRRRRSGF